MTSLEAEQERRIADLEIALAKAVAESESLRMFQAVVEQSWDTTWLLEVDGKVRYVSPARYLTGGAALSIPVGLLTLEHVLTRITPNDRAPTRAAFEEALANPGLPVFVELCELGTDRAREVLFINRLEHPDLRAVIATGRDVSHLNRPRRALRDAERRFRSLFESTSAAVTIREVERQTFIDCNDAALRLYAARSRDELRASRPTDLAPEVQPDGTRTADALRVWVEQAILHGSWRGEWLARRLNGELFTAQVRISKIDLESGSIFQSLIEDITPLTRAKEEALASSRAKSAFLATTSHELRSPLNGMIGMVDLLAGTALDERQRRYAEIARASARMLLSVINDVLDVSKIEAGKFALDETAFTVQEVFDEAACIFALAAEEKGVALVCSVSPALRGRLRGDAARIRQVVVNLLANAMKFTSSGEVVVRAATVDSNDRDVHVRIEVEDTGVGIPPAEQDRVFGPFVRLRPTDAQGNAGAGLGLSICRELVERMGGTIGLESRADRGSTFWFQLRLPRVDREPERLSEGRGDEPRIVIASGREIVRSVVRDALRDRGAKVETAATAEEVQQRLVAGTASILFVVDDPPFDGRALAALVAADERTSHTRTVFVESLRQPLADHERQALRVSASCPKPIWSARLDVIVDEILSGRTHLSAVEVPAACPPGAAVLVVDDSAVNAEVAAEILRGAGCWVEIAATGEQALAAVVRRDFDLVLLDCQLPGIDGYETARRIRTLQREGHLRKDRGLSIVALTASATSEDLVRALDAGMNDYLAKPVESVRLVRVVARHIKSTDLLAAAAPLAAEGEPRPKVVDLDVALARVGGDAAIVGRAKRTFCALAPGSWNLLRTAVARRDVPAVRFAAHRLRGQAATFEAHGLVEAVRAVEVIVDGTRWDTADVAVARVERELEQVVKALVTADT